MTDNRHPEGFNLEDPETWCGYRLLAEEPKQTCGSFGPAPTSWKEVLDRDVAGPWEGRASFEKWLAACLAGNAEDEESDHQPTPTSGLACAVGRLWGPFLEPRFQAAERSREHSTDRGTSLPSWGRSRAFILRAPPPVVTLDHEVLRPLPRRESDRRRGATYQPPDRGRRGPQTRRGSPTLGAIRGLPQED